MLLSAPSRRRTRLGAIPLLFLTIVGLLVGGLSAPASAANAIRGVVTNFDGTPLQGVQVQLGTRSGSTFTAVGSSTPTGVRTLPRGERWSTAEPMIRSRFLRW